MSTYHEMDDHGNHRIVVDGHASDWSIYQSMPTVEVGGVLYTAASAYWEGKFPIESVLKLEVVSTESRNYPGQGKNPIFIKRDEHVQEHIDDLMKEGAVFIVDSKGITILS